MKRRKTKAYTDEGVPRYVRCYDNGGETFDRYTVVLTNLRIGYQMYLAMSEHPFHPQGFGQHETSQTPIDSPAYGHLGRKVTFESLPPDVQRCVMQDYRELWGQHESDPVLYPWRIPFGQETLPT